MHVQARAKPQKSPPDLVEFLKILAPGGPDDINIEGVTGSGIESVGHFVFTVTDGREREAHDRLTAAKYHVQWTNDLYSEMIPGAQTSEEEPDPNQPGVLLGIVERAKNDTSIAKGRNIDTVLIGAVTDEREQFYAQVTFVGSVWQDQPPEEG
jgi:hypothetical protein